MENTDYRLYLESQFSRVHDKLDAINIQTTKTNGRVTDLEGQIDTIRTEEYKNCPIITRVFDVEKDVKQIKDDLLEYNFFKRYPKISILIIGFALIMFGLSSYATVSSLHRNSTDKKTNAIIERIDTNTE